ncbi:MAG: heavy-metal-associated domain-containing protein [Neisseriaceae bacterium]|nr:heavy-metal-associated domain-containing protein [Neisseriaceae bacterium]MBQ9182589.1 heavy-metal-associated domain-containing protein [Neisseriaceae bacterium]MBQ9258524.1 heavy-metal-associated domain-containing protein [Neisseriaceae bacterium]MBQ9724272.1 heavy-metal-associated domain-containing protein [Neisseriaceae bacterium]MBR1819289.1 heavy-metal-associated domain-containing protein [Neisseriaceae bacterium]
METVTISVGGMTCGGCAAGVKKALEQVSGVASADVNLAENCATVSFDQQQTNVAALREAIENAGFDAN